MQILEQAFAPQLLELVVEHDARESPGARDLADTRAADEQVAAPGRELVTRIHGEPRRRDRRQPHHDRLLDAFAERHGRDSRAVVVASEAPLRPAVVAARQDQVDLVAAVRAVLGGQHYAAGMHDETELVAMPVAEHLGPSPGLSLERIV